ncbi:conjugal transfer protein [Streptomyces albidoflavus]|uniref:conjugal transfer protein n=1 Tax=Streptomyces albidoflavus TaxID=1886 RepID=UPI002F911105|nr:conjugal transfer protein [Streptomyces albidoflavus]WTD45901.1 conjugal transfer protein [Streptomyces albidoflavus]WTD86209.1 conjugal transfer protein [Streptomyces albidoflavus]
MPGGDQGAAKKPETGAAGGWVTVSSGALANLSTMLRWGAWLLLVLGVLLSTTAHLRLSAEAPRTAQPPAKATPASGEAVGPGGFAVLYVAAYLEAGRGTEAALARYFPNMRNIRLEAKAGAQHAEQLAAVQVEHVSTGYWSVTVAGRVTAAPSATEERGEEQAKDKDEPDQAGTLRYFQVPVRTAADTDGYVATALPAEVGAPETGDGVELDYGSPVPGDAKDETAATTARFFSAYLAGAGELDRYLAPRTALRPVSPAPYTQVEVAQLAELGGDYRRNLPASDGTRRQLLVDLWAAAPDRQLRPLTYALTLTARDGRWEIAALNAAPALATPKEK